MSVIDAYSGKAVDDELSQYENQYNANSYDGLVEKFRYNPKAFKEWADQTKANVIDLYQGWEPRHYQVGLFKHLGQLENDGSGPEGLKSSLMDHRRSGKTVRTIKAMLRFIVSRPATYGFFFPSLKTGRQVIWDALDNDGRPIIEYIPKALWARKDNHMMQVKLHNGSVFQIFGATGPDGTVGHLRGINPWFSSLDEFAEMDPDCWNYVLAPIHDANGGPVVFQFTPRGENHAWRQHRVFQECMLAGDSRYYAAIHTIEDTFRHDGRRVITEDAIEERRRLGTPEEVIQQEYYCSVKSGAVGSYYGEQFRRIEDEGRICRVPYSSRYPVYTFWDIGYNDYTSIWVAQFPDANTVNLIHFIQDHNKPLWTYFPELYKLGIPFKKHFVPWDGKQTESNGLTKIQNAEAQTTVHEPIEYATRRLKQSGIEAAWAVLPNCYFDDENCHEGINALKQYKRKFEATTKNFSNNPVHDEYSHGADAFRTLACVVEDGEVQIGPNSELDMFVDETDMGMTSFTEIEL